MTERHSGAAGGCAAHLAARFGAMPARVRGWWMAGLLAALSYGLVQLWGNMMLPPGVYLVQRIPYLPLWKCAMALLLARAAWFHAPRRERRWLVAALVFSLVGDLLLALPGLRLSFVGGLGAFLLAHLAYLALFVPLAGDARAPRLLGCGVVIGTGGTLLHLFQPNLGGLAWPVALYMGVLCAMVCAALVARLPTGLAALGALCFVVSDALIGYTRFLAPFDSYPLAVWWTYAAAQLLLVAGIVMGRAQPAAS